MSLISADLERQAAGRSSIPSSLWRAALQGVNQLTPATSERWMEAVRIAQSGDVVAAGLATRTSGRLIEQVIPLASSSTMISMSVNAHLVESIEELQALADT
jgi:hypothetical protein